MFTLAFKKKDINIIVKNDVGIFIIFSIYVKSFFMSLPCYYLCTLNTLTVVLSVVFVLKKYTDWVKKVFFFIDDLLTLIYRQGKLSSQIYSESSYRIALSFHHLFRSSLGLLALNFLFLD